MARHNPGQGTGEDPLSPRRLSVAQRQRKALQLRIAGASFEAIAQQVGYKDHSGAYRAVRSALQKTLGEPADEVRRLESERLDRLQLALWKRAVEGDEAAVQGVLKIMGRRAKLQGLDAPTRTEILGAGGEPFFPPEVQRRMMNDPRAREATCDIDAFLAAQDDQPGGSGPAREPEPLADDAPPGSAESQTDDGGSA